MKRTWTIVGVSDVPRSFKWYQALFGQPALGPATAFAGGDDAVLHPVNLGRERHRQVRRNAVDALISTKSAPGAS